MGDFATLIYWIAFGYAVVYLLHLVRLEVERRQKVRRVRALIERREALNNAEPQRWTP